jgi:hypothetical protein
MLTEDIKNKDTEALANKATANAALKIGIDVKKLQKSGKDVTAILKAAELIFEVQ